MMSSRILQRIITSAWVLYTISFGPCYDVLTDFNVSYEYFTDGYVYVTNYYVLFTIWEMYGSGKLQHLVFSSYKYM